jgi:hypothetical protein
VLIGPGAYTAGPNGVYVGRFCWEDPGLRLVVNSTGSGPVTGFIHREQQALITTWLSESTMLIPRGLIVTVHSAGDFIVRNTGATFAAAGQKAYAMYGTGAVQFAATGTPPAGPAITCSNAAGTGTSTLSTFTGDNILTVGGVVTGSFNPGGTVTGAGVVAGTTISSQLSGTPGGAGTYSTTPRFANSIPVAQAINETHGIMTVTVAGATPLQIGDVISGGIGTITAFGTGTGGLGTYITSNNTVVASGAQTTAGGVETKWIAMSGGGPNELIYISSWPLG